MFSSGVDLSILNSSRFLVETEGDLTSWFGAHIYLGEVTLRLTLRHHNQTEQRPFGSTEDKSTDHNQTTGKIHR